MRAHVLRAPIVTFDGAILDGRNRYRACRAAQVPIRLEPYAGGDAVAYVVSLNLKRRHLNKSQRSVVAAKLANLEQGRPVEDKGANLRIFGDPLPQPVSQGAAADLLNVSRRYVQAARVVVDQGAPELIHKVEIGAVSVSAAADVARLPEPEQTAIVARGEQEILRAGRPSLRSADLRNGRAHHQASVPRLHAIL